MTNMSESGKQPLGKTCTIRGEIPFKHGATPLEISVPTDVLEVDDPCLKYFWKIITHFACCAMFGVSRSTPMPIEDANSETFRWGTSVDCVQNDDELFEVVAQSVILLPEIHKNCLKVAAQLTTEAGEAYLDGLAQLIVRRAIRSGRVTAPHLSTEEFKALLAKSAGAGRKWMLVQEKMPTDGTHEND